MNTFTSFIRFGLLSVSTLLPFLSATPLRAQLFAEDIRISDSIPQPVLPEDIRIQSAARIGETVLVVWGSTRNVSNDSAANVLYRQILQGEEKRDVPEFLVEGEQDPFGYVQVIPLEKRFLVLWNDRKGGKPGTWNVQVEADGTSGTPAPFFDTLMITPQVVRFVRTGSLHLLLWNDTAVGRIFARQLDSSGRFISDPYPLADGSISDVFGEERSGGEPVVGRRNLPPLILLSDGTAGTLPEGAAGKFRHTFHIGTDGKVLIVRNDSLFEYASIHADVPLHGWEYDLPFSSTPAFPGYDRRLYFLPQLVYPFYSNTGDIYLTFTLLESEPIGDFLGSAWLYVSEHVMRKGTEGFDSAVKIGSGQLWSGVGRMHIRSWKFEPYIKDMCAGFIHKEIRAVLGILYERNGPDTGFVVHPTLSYTVDRNLDFDLLESALPSRKSPDYPALWGHCSSTDLIINRPIPSDSSRVCLQIDGDITNLAAPVGTVPRLVSSTSPAAIDRDGSLGVFWKGKGTFDFIGHRDWDLKRGPGNGNVTPLYNVISAGKPDRPDSLSLQGVQAGTLPVFSILERIDRSAIDTVRYEHRVKFLVPERSGTWRSLTDNSYTVTAWYAAARTPAPLSIRQDPDDHSLLISGRHQHPPDMAFNRYAVLFDSNHTMLWRLDDLQEKAISGISIDCLPVSQEKFISISPDHRFRLHELGSVIFSDSIPGFLPSMIHAGYDGTFIQIERDKTRFRLSRYNEFGERTMQSIPVTALHKADHYSIVTNPADSGIVLLYRWNEGIRGVVFDRDLQFMEQRDVSAMPTEAWHPTGIFRGDTLVVLWEDMRMDRVPTIYANALLPKTSLSVGSDIAEGNPEPDLLLSPNPATDILRITLNRSLTGTARLSLIDLLGKEVRREEMEPGSRTATVDLSGLPKGTYLVRLTEEGRSFHRQCILQ